MCNSVGEGLLVWIRWHRHFSLLLPAKHNFMNPGNGTGKGKLKDAKKKARWFGNPGPEEQRR